MHMQYSISKTELIRRKKAYVVLAVSLVVGFTVGASFFNLPLTSECYIFLVAAIISLGAFSLFFFYHIAQLKIILTNNSLQRVSKKFTENYLLSQLKRVEIKWTTKQTIREIHLWFDPNESISLTALENFDQFRKELLAKLNKQVIVKERSEPLAYDHPLFYPILGLFLSNIAVWLISLLAKSNYGYHFFLINTITLFVYLVVFSFYFFINRPISKRSGKKTYSLDFIMGTLLIIAGLFMLLLLKKNLNTSFTSSLIF